MDVSAGSPTEPLAHRPGSPPNSNPGSAQAHELSRTDAALYLGISKPEFRRREKQGRYRPCRVDGRGYKYYDRRTLGANAVTATTSENEPSTTIQTLHASAAPDPNHVRSVFTELAKDEDLVRVVLATDLPPAEVLGIHASWTILRERSGGFHVSRRSLDAINALGFDGLPARSEHELVAALAALRDGTRNCERCRREPRRPGTYCGACHKEVASIERAEIERAANLRVLSRRAVEARREAKTKRA